MDINAVNDDPTELAKRYCKEHELDYIEQGTHVEVEIQKDMLQVCRVKIKDLLKQRKALEEKIETLSNASVSVRHFLVTNWEFVSILLSNITCTCASPSAMPARMPPPPFTSNHPIS